MPTRSGAGSLNSRVEFQQPVLQEDGHGGTIVGWEAVFTEPGRLTPRIGGEDVVGQRLQGKQPYILRVRSSTRTRAVKTEWRVVNSRSGSVYSIKSATNLDERNAYVDLLVVEGDDE